MGGSEAPRSFDGYSGARKVTKVGEYKVPRHRRAHLHKDSFGTANNGRENACFQGKAEAPLQTEAC